MKGRVDEDVADEAILQCWGAREVLLRLGYPAEQVVLAVGVRHGAGEDRPVEDRTPFAVVQLRWAGMPSFNIECGPAGLPKRKFFRRLRTYMTDIGLGTHSEETLARRFSRTSAYLGRVELIASLRKAGFPVPTPSNIDPRSGN